MSCCIFYFTGTENSLKIAKDLSQNIGDCEIHSLVNYKNRDNKFDKIGFVFPVYTWGPPVVVTRFIYSFSSIIKPK